MRQLALVIVIAGAIGTFVPSPAQAWYCSARATTGAWGWGRSIYLSSARVIALREFAVRTPRYAACYIMYCR